MVDDFRMCREKICKNENKFLNVYLLRNYINLSKCFILKTSENHYTMQINKKKILHFGKNLSQRTYSLEIFGHSLYKKIRYHKNRNYSKHFKILCFICSF